MSYLELKTQALEVKKLYDKKNLEDGRPSWNVGNYMSGFVGDVGDLAKLIMAKEGLRFREGVDEKVQHELADCLWSIIVIADELGIDIETTFSQTMLELKTKLTHEQ